jgi:hypothetical protein
MNLGMESDVHWRRTKLSCCRTLILLAFAAVALASPYERQSPDTGIAHSAPRVLSSNCRW